MPLRDKKLYNAIQNPESNNLRLMLMLVFKLNMRLKLNKIKRFESKIEWFESDFGNNKQTNTNKTLQSYCFGSNHFL